MESAIKKDMKNLSRQIKKANQEKEFLLSQNAIRRVGIQATINEIQVLKDGNKAFYEKIKKMKEENMKFEETHVQSKLLIEDCVARCEEERDLLNDF